MLEGNIGLDEIIAWFQVILIKSPDSITVEIRNNGQLKLLRN